MSHSRPHRGNGAGPHRGIPLDQCRWIDSSANASNRVRGAPEAPHRRGAGPGFRPWRGRGGPARQYGTRRFRLPVPVIPTRPRPPTPEIDPENGRVDVNDFDLSIITSPEPGDAKSITDFPQGTSRSSTLGIGLSSGLTSKDPAWPRIQVDGMVPRAKMRKADILKTPSEASRIGDARTSSPMDHHRFTPPQSSVCVASPRSVISSEKAPASSHPDNVGNSGSDVSRAQSSSFPKILFRPKIVVNNERLQRKTWSSPPVKLESGDVCLPSLKRRRDPDSVVQPEDRGPTGKREYNNSNILPNHPLKQRSDDVVPPEDREVIVKTESNDEVDTPLPPFDDRQDGVLFEPMNDACRWIPGRSDREIKASRRLWRKEFSNGPSMRGKIIHRVIYRSDGMAIHWRRATSGIQADPTDFGSPHRSHPPQPPGARMSDIESADNEKGTKEPENKAVQVKREASVEFEHESPRAESSEPNRLPTGDDSLTDMLTDDSYDELLPTPSILPTYDSQNNSDLSTTESFPNVQGLLLSRSDLIGLAEHREGYRLLSLPFHVMSVSKDGDMEFTTRGPPRSLIPDWEIRASAGNKLCSVDQWEDGRSSSVYFAYSSAAYPIARLQMQGNDRAPTLDHIQANPHRHAIVDRVCALPSSPSSVRFVTSANDGTCFHWSAESPSSEPTVERLNIYTSAPLNDLSFCSETSSLYLCGNDGTVSKFDMHSATSSTVLSLDAAPRHLHVHSSNVILLETDDPDLEFEIRDLRTPRSSCRFGYDRRSHLSFEGRGDLQSGLFARGDAKGTVRLWDLRNVEDHFSYTVARGRQVPHVIFNSITRDRVQLISCLADNRLSFSTLVATP